MNFTTPQTKAEMYDTLKDIFAYYKIQRDPFVEVDLLPLSLEREVFTTMTSAELEQKANTLLSSKFSEKKQQKLDENMSKILELSNKEGVYYQNYVKDIEDIDVKYDELIEKVKAEAKKNGLISSDVTVAEISRLESERIALKTARNKNFDDTQADINEKISSLERERNDIENFYADLLSKEVAIKILELKDEQDQKYREVFRYNNGLDEKEQKSANAIIQANANLRLKYAEINSHELSKDKLIELGYYKDVIDCVCGYYDNAFTDSVSIYQDIVNEPNIAIYLEDYYAEVLLMYRTRAGF